MKLRIRIGWGSLALGMFACTGVHSPGSAQILLSTTTAQSAAPDGSATITFLQTNDIHGGVEATKQRDGTPIGGMAAWAGIVNSVRQGTKNKSGGVLVVDSGDQFQGTLISNYSEGTLVFDLMNRVGYDVAITGNHDYDFGPIGWLIDQAPANSPKTDDNLRGALLKLVERAKFPLISANTYLKSSLKDISGKDLSAEVAGIGCKSASIVDWSRARQPNFLTPYLIKTVSGVRVALIGIDNSSTPSTTTEANVDDLCFRDEAETYLEVRKELQGKADVFVMVIHDGDADTDHDATDLVTKITASGQPDVLHAVLAGHTHFINKFAIAGVPVIQSGSGGKLFGRVDLVYDRKLGKVDMTRTKYYAGVPISATQCDPQIADFCTATGGAAVIEGVPVRPDPGVTELIAQARKDIAPMATARLGHADGEIRVDRIGESPLANALTDALRQATKTEIAFMNTGGIRAPIAEGDFDYENFYQVIPFNNRAVVMDALPIDKLVRLLARSVRTCGNFGALMQSGLRVTYTRNCAGAPASGPDAGTDPQAKLTRVETIGGEVVYADGAIPQASATRTFKIATLDFLAAGGSGFVDFKGTPITLDAGIARELIVNLWESHPVELKPQPDGRWSGAGH